MRMNEQAWRDHYKFVEARSWKQPSPPSERTYKQAWKDDCDGPSNDARHRRLGKGRVPGYRLRSNRWVGGWNTRPALAGEKDRSDRALHLSHAADGFTIHPKEKGDCKLGENYSGALPGFHLMLQPMLGFWLESTGFPAS